MCNEAESVLLGSILEGLHLDLDWTGDLSWDDSFSSDVEHDLLAKMQFVNKDAPPFAASTLLKKLEEKKPDCSVSNLFMAAEHSGRYPDRALVHLRKYISDIRNAETPKKLHPWSLVVASRVVPESSDRLISAFCSFYPLQKTILSIREAERLSSDQSSHLDFRMEWPEALRNQWTQLQVDYPTETNSEATDKLLKLTGLRKVKEEALRLWNSALQLRRMDADARKKNQRQQTTPFSEILAPVSKSRESLTL